MGYEARFYVVDKSNSTDENGYFLAQEIAQFTLSKVASKLNVNKYPPTDCFIYDGNTPIYEDSYGDPLREIPIPDMIEQLEGLLREDPSHRRYQPFLQLLKGFDESQWKKIVILHYGY